MQLIFLALLPGGTAAEGTQAEWSVLQFVQVYILPGIDLYIALKWFSF